MAVIKIFDSNGVKTLVMLGNAVDQDYDTDEDIEEVEEQDDNPF